MRSRPATIGGMMIAVVWCALLFAVVRIAGKDIFEWNARLFLISLGVITGAIAQRRWEGSFLLGGLIGGMVVYIGLIAVMHLRAYLYPDPKLVTYVGPGRSFVHAVYFGVLIGLVVGLLVLGVILVDATIRQERKKEEE